MSVEAKQILPRDRELPYVVLVDDNELLLRAMRRWLFGELGWTADCYSEPEEALKALQQPDVDVDILIVDLRMPQMNGIEFLYEVQSYQEDAIQILMTGHDSHDAMLDAFNRIDLYFFMEKPWDPQKLSLMLRHAWDKRRLTFTLEKRINEFEETFHNLRATQVDLLRHKSQATIGELMQGICHNLNTPLSVIVGQLEVLGLRLSECSDGMVPVRAIQPAVQSIQEASERIQHIVQNMMIKSRLEQSSEKQSQSIDKLIHQELEFLQAEPFLKDKVEVRLQMGGDIPNIMINYGDFSQVFGNIVHNALDAMHDVENPCLEVRAYLQRGDKQMVALEIHDNGPGVPNALHERIFEPFFTTKLPVEETVSSPLNQEDVVPQDDVESSSSPRGTGLGLHSVVQLLAPYQGEVILCDSPLGGACFKVLLPLSLQTQHSPSDSKVN